jgi:hypothetical protein
VSRRPYDAHPRWVPSGRLFVGHVGFQDKTCFVCGKLIPKGVPHQIRAMCVYAACATCDYPREKGNYQ